MFKNLARSAKHFVCKIRDYAVNLLLIVILILFVQTIFWPSSLNVFILMLLVLVLVAFCWD